MGAAANRAHQDARRGSGSDDRGESARANRAYPDGRCEDECARQRRNCKHSVVSSAQNARRRGYLRGDQGGPGRVHARVVRGTAPEWGKTRADNAWAGRYGANSKQQAPRSQCDALAGRRRASDDANRQLSRGRVSGGDNPRAAVRSGAPALNLSLHSHRLRPSSFTARFAIALVAGLVAAVIVAPIAALAVVHAGWRFPFPRIFDRTVMVTLFLAMLWATRDLQLGSLLARGFRHPAKESLLRVLRGLAVSFCAIAILFALALWLGGGGTGDFGKVASRIPGYILSAIAIAIIEEG